jgi:Asp-tRNA(Asn)/Glu-tRNA(Gln) amidotransferase A subunit family amidase
MKKCLLLLSLIASISANAQDTISLQDIARAEKLAALTFTPAERDSMLRDIRGNRDEYLKMQAHPLDNSIPMSMWQMPVQVNNNTKQLPVKWIIPAGVQLPDKKSDLAFYSVLQLASLIKNKKISSVDLTLFYIDRIKTYGNTLQCVISITEDIALQQARAADAEIAAGKYRGPLHGIPYGLKDLFAVKGTKTTWGAAPYKEQVIENDAFVYQQLRQAGAVLVAKFTLGALAMGDHWYGGQTKNPWNLAGGSSGSSAGSASATVAGLVPFAIGTETWGSIISPSHVCGATGLRPSFGAISRTGAMTLSWSLDKPGPICRSAEDAAIVFNSLRGTDGLDLAVQNQPFNYTGKTDWKKMKIGYAKNYFDKKDTASNDYRVLREFRKMGVQLIPMEFPDSAYYHFDIISIVISAESAAAFDQFTRSELDDMMTRKTKNDWPNYFRASRFIPAVEYINALRHRYVLMQQVNKVVNRYDAVICPTFSGNQLAITNLTGHPALCFPTGFNKQQLPTSITLIGKLFDEATLLAVARAYQLATGYDEVHPPLFQQ